MESASDPISLRPLRIGEIFGRAIALYARHFTAFSAIALLVVVPLTVLQNVVWPGDASLFAQVLGGLTRGVPAKAPVPLTQTQLLGTFAVLALSAFLGPLSMAAVAAGVARLYGGQPMDWRSCYRVVLRRAGSIAALVVAEIGILAGALLADAVVLGLVGVAAKPFVTAPGGAGLAAALAAIAALVTIGAAVALWWAIMFAFEAVVIEGAGARRALGTGFARIFNRAELWRALLAGTALVAVQAGVLLLAATGAAITALLFHARALEIALVAGIQVVGWAFFALLIALYYYDVRVRREGLDLEAAGCAQAAAASATDAGAARFAMLSREEELLVERFVARRSELEPVSRARMAARIAGLVRPRLSRDLQMLDDEELLSRLNA